MNQLVKMLPAVALCAVIGCTQPSASRPTVDSFLKIRPGKHRMEDVRNWFGEPHRVTNFRDYPDTNLKGISWTYYDPEDPYKGTGGGRVSFSFQENQPFIRSVTWNVRDNEPEHELSFAKNLFQSASFVPRELEWVNAHAGPMNTLLEDRKLGISISLHAGNGKVLSLTLLDPTFDMTSTLVDKNRPNPVYCIGDSCTQMSTKRSAASQSK